jgi:hypothetical protein
MHKLIHTGKVTSSHMLCTRDYDRISIKFDVLRLPTVEGWDGSTLKITKGFEICGSHSGVSVTSVTVLFFVVKGPAADATDAPQPWGLLCNPVMKMISFFVFPCNGARVEWNWQGKTEVLGVKPVPVPLYQPKIPHGLTRDRTRASAKRGMAY